MKLESTMTTKATLSESDIDFHESFSPFFSDKSVARLPKGSNV